MVLRKIAHIGHPVLRTSAAKVEPDAVRDDATQALIDDLIDTMRDAQGAGLAAPQVYAPVQICVIEVTDNPRYPYKPNIPLTVLVNPEIEPLSEETFENYEGCLSVPNLRGVVTRHARVRLRALDREGRILDGDFSGFTAGTLQHEIDHLHGRIFVDRVTDPTTLTTWSEFDRHHRAAFLKRADEIKARFHPSPLGPLG
ncbi:MAG: peptide deformylase [Deltaproteobacteria bacterium]|nr:peptide deformylase [Deltaproteobacteria bacterium]